MDDAPVLILTSPEEDSGDKIRCKGCNEFKDDSAFYVHPKTGLRSAKCRPCLAKYKSAWDEAHWDRANAAHAKARARYEANNPDKPAAIKAVKAAVNRGDLVKPMTCEVVGCEVGGRLEAHHSHSGEAHVLFVCFLCPGHHREVHRAGSLPLPLKETARGSFAIKPIKQPRPTQEEAGLNDLPLWATTEDERT